VDLVPELVPEPAQTEHLLAPADFLPEPGMFGDGLGDRGIQAAIEGVKIFGADRGLALDRQLGDRLTDVTVVVHHLRHGETHPQQLPSMLRRGRPDLVRWEGEARRLAPQRLHELAQDEGDPVFDLPRRPRFERARAAFRSCARPARRGSAR
jgi:hypothetical protein